MSRSRLFSFPDELDERLEAMTLALALKPELAATLLSTPPNAVAFEIPPVLLEAEEEAARGGLYLCTEDYKAICAHFKLPYEPKLRGLQFLNTHVTKLNFDLDYVNDLARERRKQCVTFRRIARSRQAPARVTYTAIVTKALDEFLTRVETEINAASKPAASSCGDARKAKAK